MPDRFQEWARTGKLATVALIVVFLAWLIFQLPWIEPEDRPSFLEQTLYTLMGGWLTNVAMIPMLNDPKTPQSKKDNDIES